MSYTTGHYMKAVPFRPKRNACLKPDGGHISATQPAAIKLRCESGASCSSSHFAAMEVQLVLCRRHVKKSSDGASIVLGPQPDTEEEGSALDFPEEYVRAVPSRRPDIFPDLKEPKQPMPNPMPADPEMPDEEEEEEERKKSPGEPGTDPDEDEDNPKPAKKDDEEDA
ncbi:hypothetical protein MICPUN_54956 [Micromonas commoda]|uniref:Uncharacterized protein n=1 Tax=Micromonas commoda (strain RCC299 / NOUM17 / CCMP2709) TaxID=296587 RepID=C1FDA0_MICCC|nr:hypothetical protein MICPUN_54956 [Micromonas commoda]ACO68750.1 hypothetical protein MICPUN_54956 [Micromonas commoda]|eukprot:XP_002507492.1 hypothetical protein MICPUN_54956 [Micromonas commoda]